MSDKQVTSALLNPGLLEKYLRQFAPANTGDELMQALFATLSKRPENLRPATAEDIANAKDPAVAIRRDMFGCRFYVFDPALDPHLGEKVKNVLDLIRLAHKVGNDWRSVQDESTPPILRGDFLYAALSPANFVQKPALPVTAQPPVKSPAPALPSSAVSVSMRSENGWKIVIYNDFLKLEDDNTRLGYALRRAIDREKMLEGETIYYGLLDAKDTPQALLEVIKHDKMQYLKQCKAQDAKLPPQEFYPHILDFCRLKQFSIPSAAETAIIKNGASYNYLLDLPRGYHHGSSLEILNCNDLVTLGNLTTCYRLKAEDNKNLVSIGKLANTHGGASFRNCASLASIQGLKQVGGDLDVRGTAIRSLPDDLYVQGHIHTDMGSFTFNRSARKAFRRKYPQPPQLPPPKNSDTCP